MVRVSSHFLRPYTDCEPPCGRAPPLCCTAAVQPLAPSCVPLLLLSFCRAAAEPLPLQPDYNTQTTRSRGEIWQLPRGATPAIVGANLENVLAKV